jgi:hypothetical protein
MKLRDFRVMDIGDRYCRLKGLYGVKCTQKIELHHIINFSQARGNTAVRQILKSNPPELTEWVCSAHNVGRWADTSEARSRLLRLKIQEFGYEHMRWFVDEFIGDLWKIPRPEMRLDALLG